MLKIVAFCIATVCYFDFAIANQRVDFVYRTNSERILYEGSMFIPIITAQNSLLFSDMRFISDFDKSDEFNFGLGARHYLKEFDLVFGAYYFHDYRNIGEIFQQNTMGVEVLGKSFETRANFYFPCASRSISSVTSAVSGMQPQVVYSLQEVMEGHDLELGFKLPLKNKELWLYGGYYSFESEQIYFKGKKVRAEFNFVATRPNEVMFSIGAEYDYNNDNSRGGVSFTFRAGLPLCKDKRVCRSDYRMIKPIARDVDVRVGEEKVVEDATVIITDRPKPVSEFDEIAYVTTEKGLYYAIEHNRSDKSRLIVMKNDIMAIRDINLLVEDCIVGNQVERLFIGKTSLREAYDSITDKNVYTPKLDVFDKDDNIYGINRRGLIAIYDSAEYDNVKFVQDQAGLLNAIEESDIVVVEENLALVEELDFDDHIILIGEGQLPIIDPDGKEHLLEFHNMPEISGLKFGGTMSESNYYDITFDGFKMSQEVSIDQADENRTMVLKVKNSIF